MNFTEGFLNKLNMGLVLLSSELHVIGLNDYASKIFGATAADLGKNIQDYHPGKSRARVQEVLREMIGAPPGEARTLIIDVLGKAIMSNLSQLTLTSLEVQTCWAVTFFDVTTQTGAKRNPLSGLVEMKKIPVAEGSSYRFIAIDEVLAICADGDYCRIYTTDGSYYLHLTLKNLLQRYPNPTLFRVHKSYVANLSAIRQTVRTANNQWQIILDHDHSPAIPPIPISRRKLVEFRNALALI